MEFRISPEMFDLFPGLNIGVVLVKDTENKGDEAKIYNLLEEVEEFIKMGFVSEKSISIDKIKKVVAEYFGLKTCSPLSKNVSFLKFLPSRSTVPRFTLPSF